MHNCSVLLVDDNEDTRKTIASILERNGFQVTQTENGKEALKIFSNSSFDLVVTDIFMAEGDGLELLILLKTTSVEIPVIVITGGWAGSDVDIAGACRRLSAAAILEKPFRETHLLETIDGLLNPSGLKTTRP